MTNFLSEIQPLLASDRLMDLGPGTPNRSLESQLRKLGVLLLMKAKDRDFASACLAGLWLLHNFHDESHAISQDLNTVEGSYWHGILHRREPDYGNAKYWFRRVPRHPIFADLQNDASALTDDAGVPTGSEGLVERNQWDPFAFIDLCERAGHGPEALTMLCRRIQQREWELLFAYCHERAFPMQFVS